MPQQLRVVPGRQVVRRLPDPDCRLAAALEAGSFNQKCLVIPKT
jgi:hypothetical protein